MRAYEAVADCLRARSQDRTPQDQIEAGDGSPGLHAPPLLVLNFLTHMSGDVLGHCLPDFDEHGQLRSFIHGHETRV